MSASSYFRPHKQANAEYIIKKSRFISFAFPIESRSEAMKHLQGLKEQYPDARHHCWAYLLGHPELSASAAMSDDGEPSGTAGKPILNVIQHKAISDIVIIVVRYFGGVKLGAGGLTRAYSQSAQQVLLDTETVLWQPQTHLKLIMRFKQEQAVRHQLQRLKANIINVSYDQVVNIWLKTAQNNVPTIYEYAAANHIQVIQVD